VECDKGAVQSILLQIKNEMEKWLKDLKMGKKTKKSTERGSESYKKLFETSRRSSIHKSIHNVRKSTSHTHEHKEKIPIHLKNKNSYSTLNKHKSCVKIAQPKIVKSKSPTFTTKKNSVAVSPDQQDNLFNQIKVLTFENERLKSQNKDLKR